MKRNTLTRIIDTAVTFLASMFFIGAVAAYFLKGLLPIAAAAFTGGVCITALIGISQKKRNKTVNPEISQTIAQFIYSTDSKNLSFFFDVLSKKYAAVLKDGYLKVNSSVVFTDFKPRKLNHTELARMYATAIDEGAKRLIILSYDGFDKDSSAVINCLPNIKTYIFDSNKTHALLKSFNALPEITLKLIRPQRSSIKDFLINAADPTRSRNYFFISFVLILSSFVMPYSIYYTVISAICLGLGIVAKLDIRSRLKKNKT